MKKKALIWGLSVFALLVLGANVARAQFPILSDLSLSLAAEHLVIIDPAEQDETMDYYLPSTTLRNGQTYTYKMYGAANGNTVVIHAASGDTIDMGTKSFQEIYNQNAGMNPFLTFVADSANDTWWIVNKGNTN
ncbi:MAG TPA: hypothetical protein VHE10_00970 [Candidatus Paceibacterota bacterium]|nr:hypothetical protein [Candidatus Paceibacterota bacterium]